ncbi:hypothetical protein [Streptomyces sp. NPDC059909]|uniref:hypothetical protein n=1 Tax=Streptomyces sp. NPDC059909 TaxID=3346998 RepID=UPI003664DF19
MAHSYTLDDTRAPLPAATVERVCALLEREVVRRLSGASRFDVAVLDADLAGLTVPAAESRAARALVSLPRGSTQPLPQGEVRADLGRIGKDLYQYFTAGRTTLWDLAVWHAAARTDEVAVVRREELWHYRRREGEQRTDFAARVRGLTEPQGRGRAVDAEQVAQGREVLLALVQGDLAPSGAARSVYRLLPGPVDSCGLEQLAAGDLVAALG